jgi:hypothetical protein
MHKQKRVTIKAGVKVFGTETSQQPATDGSTRKDPLIVDLYSLGDPHALVSKVLSRWLVTEALKKKKKTKLQARS